MAGEIDKQVKVIIDLCYNKAKEIIRSYEDILHSSANLLIEKEKIGREDFEALFESHPAVSFSGDVAALASKI
jgi:cell division protease FtsH